MTKKKISLKDVMKYVTLQVAGEESFVVADYLRKKKKRVSEFKIAEDLKVDVHYVRVLLYKLDSQHLVTYIRKKDIQKGWYISYWQINEIRFRDMYERLQKQKLKKVVKN